MHDLCFAMLPTSYARDIFFQLHSSGILPSALFLSLLSDPEFAMSDELFDITEHLDAILAACRRNVRLSGKVHAWAAATMTDLCMKEVSTLTSKASNMRFNARQATLCYEC